MYYSIFDFQGTVGLCFSIGWLKQTLLRKAHPFGLWSVRDDFSDEKSFPATSRLERQPVYLSIGEICCQAIFLFFSEFFIGCFFVGNFTVLFLRRIYLFHSSTISALNTKTTSASEQQNSATPSGCPGSLPPYRRISI